MKMKLLRVPTVLIAVLTFVLSGAAGMDAYAFDNSVKSGTVAIVLYLKDAKTYITDGEKMILLKNYGNIQYSRASGFFVGKSGEDPKYIVTNCHVIDDYLKADEGEEYTTILSYDDDGYAVWLNASSCELRVYYSDNDFDVAYVDCPGDTNKVDLAVLRLRNATNKRRALSLLSPTDDMVGDTVYTVGYPGNADNDFSGASQYGVDDATVHKGSITRFVMNEGKGVERIAIDATVQHGNSGGPLVTEDGYVIGVNTNVESNVLYGTQVEADYYAISTNEVIRFLDKNSIPYDMAGSQMSNIDFDSDSGFDSESNITPAFEKTNTQKSGSSSDSGVKIAIAVGIVVGLIVGGAVLLKKKKSPHSSVVPAASNNSNSIEKKAVVYSASPQHNGRAFSVSRTPVTIGRNASSCNIVFKDGTPGVSSRHCTISYDPGTEVFTLTDLNSSYGTFLGNGMKLTPNSPINLRSGDIFYVGDKANVLKVEVER